MNKELSPHVSEPLTENGIALREGMYFDYQGEQYIIRHLDESTSMARCQIAWTKILNRENAFLEFKIEFLLNFCQAKLLD
jgi:hypothetical protein